jgi:hypothetical protein
LAAIKDTDYSPCMCQVRHEHLNQPESRCYCSKRHDHRDWPTSVMPMSCANCGRAIEDTDDSDAVAMCDDCAEDPDVAGR